MTNDEMQLLTQTIFELKIEMEKFAERQDEMLNDVKKIKEVVYNPDSGIYARLRELEQWKNSQSKIQGAVILTVVGLVTSTLYKIIVES